MKNLKTATAILTLVLLVSFNAFAQQINREVTRMLEDKQKREALFSAILNNEEMKQELMKRVMADKNQSGMMMQNMMNQAKSDSSMCNMMVQDGHMMDMMMSNMMDGAEKDPAMCKKMCAMMMDSDKMMNMMENMKNNEGRQGSGNTEEKNHMQHHMDDQHKGKKKN